MKTKVERPMYEPPQARDLSALSVSGGPLGACTSGNYPFYNCSPGSVYVASCTPGSGVDTSACSTGSFHSSPTCTNIGLSAATICITGAHQQV